MNAQENGKEDPCMKILLKEMKSWENDCAILKKCKLL